MAKGLNKHTPDSEELLKRLNANDSSGLDDFEKEALEGFDSLDNAELAKNLTDSLNKKIEEKYFQKEGGNKKGFVYLSLAAGLVLVAGLAIFFTNIMGDKKEMAMSSDTTTTTENIANEVKAPTDLALAPPSEEKEEAKAEGSTAASGGDAKPNQENLREQTYVSTEDVSGKKARAKDQPNDDGLSSRMVVKEKKKELNDVVVTSKTADLESRDDYKKQDADKLAQQGPGSIPASPVAVADQKNKLSEESNLDEVEKSPKVTTTNANTTPANTKAAGGKGGKDVAMKSAEPRKESKNEKASGESLGKEDSFAETTVSTNSPVGGVVNGNNNNSIDNNGYVHTTEYDSRVYSKPQDYIKTEINKSEMLKTNVKAFKAELTIDENGKVKDVKFLTAFSPSCVACEKEVRKILINMPGWKATPSKKAVKETVSYIDQ